MQIKLDGLAAHLAQGLRSAYTVWGDEALLAQEATDAIRAAARGRGFTERQVFTVAGSHFDWSAVQAQASSLSLFAEAQIVELRIPGGKPGKEGGEAIQRLCESLGPELLLLVTLPRLDKTQLESAWFRALDGAGITLRADPIERRALPTWLARRAHQLGLQLADGEEGQQALLLLVERVEGNLLAAQQELEKLALLRPDGILDVATIDEAVSDVARFEAGQLSEALWAGDLARTLRLLDALQAEGEAAVRLHWLLADDVRALRRAAHAKAGGQPLPMAWREARVWGQRVQVLERALPKMSPRALDGLVQAASVVDGLCKGLRAPGWPEEPWAALRQWVLMILAAQRPAQAARLHLAA
ncbi:DNA polymerase III subunit delta [Inhella crocodyli]|uniref:DNA polymerase III subunit delta n=1 Tax=Inhella crocodyli TaxID=2499851 RepID=A0A437LTV3_9BURK|nr:DNA polymerase III subunit delta [Inhella crocodyli]RVT88855.1 DNA polymerase III subunit delta [Inhella crocodyli]